MQLTHRKLVYFMVTEYLSYMYMYIVILGQDHKAMIMATMMQTLACSLPSLDEVLDETSSFSAWIA